MKNLFKNSLSIYRFSAYVKKKKHSSALNIGHLNLGSTVELWKKYIDL